MRPVASKAFDKDITFDLETSQEVLVIGQSSTNFSMQFREFDLVVQLFGVQDVLKPGKCVVEVLHLGSLEDKVTLSSMLFDVLVEFHHRDILGQVTDEDSLHGLVLLGRLIHWLLIGQILERFQIAELRECAKWAKSRDVGRLRVTLIQVDALLEVLHLHEVEQALK